MVPCSHERLEPICQAPPCFGIHGLNWMCCTFVALDCCHKECLLRISRKCRSKMAGKLLRAVSKLKVPPAAGNFSQPGSTNGVANKARHSGPTKSTDERAKTIQDHTWNNRVPVLFLIYARAFAPDVTLPRGYHRNHSSEQDDMNEIVGNRPSYGATWRNLSPNKLDCKEVTGSVPCGRPSNYVTIGPKQNRMQNRTKWDANQFGARDS